jgi:chorismate lyase/3-hydroxybenzoate synthase
VRDEADATHVADVLHARLPRLGGLLLLGGDICRGELLVEVDGVHQLAD